MRQGPDLAAVAELVRLPAVLTVPGDVLLGASFVRTPRGASPGAGALRDAAALSAASSLLYLAGMALNDYADRDVDAAERPHRPIPSGRVSPGFALRLATALTAGAVAIAGAVGGRRALAVAAPLAGMVWAYDLALKQTPAGPPAMAACRVLDVLLGASVGRLSDAAPGAEVLGAHTLLVTLVSRREAQGASRGFAQAALGGAAAVTALAAAVVLGEPSGQGGKVLRTARTAAGVALLSTYANALVRAGVQAVRDPTPAKLQRVVGTGILGFVPLQGSLLARRAPAAVTAAVTAAWPLSRILARRKAVT